MVTDPIAEIERLARLHAAGALTTAEFQSEKARLLAPQTAHSASRPRWKFVIAVLIAGVAVFGLLIAVLLVRRPPAPDSGVALFVSDYAGAPVTNEVAAGAEDAPLAETPAPSSEPDYYAEAKRDAEQAYASMPANIRRLLGDEAGANTKCRGGTDQATIDHWCPIRDRLVRQLQAAGMCYGRPTDESAAESDWHVCDAGDEPQTASENQAEA